MKKVQTATKANKSEKRNGKTVTVAGVTIKRPTPVEIIEGCLFRDEQDPEARVETLDIYRNRIPGASHRLFQPDIMRAVSASIENRGAEVMIAVRLSALDWQKLIANEMDEARNWIVQQSNNNPNSQWKIPTCGSDGVLARMVAQAVRKSLKGVAQ